MNLIVTHESGLSYELNSLNFTAKVVSSPNASGDIFIPHSINHQSQEYLITTINEVSFKHNGKIKSLNFSNESKICSINKEAFANSSLTSIIIPKHVKIIGEGAFLECSNLKTIEFPEDSELLTIERETFSSSSIEKLIVPKHVKQISEFAFKDCINLESIEFPENSELETIEKDAFYNSSLEQITIPSRVKELKEGWCHCVSQLVHITISQMNSKYVYFDSKMILGKSQSSVDDFDVLLFARRDIDRAIVPKSIQHITSFAFSDCCSIQSIEFEKGSKLNSIGIEAFGYSSLHYLMVPPQVTEIGESAFIGCINLLEVQFSKDSQLISIGKSVFSNSTLKKIAVPSSVSQIDKKSFFECNNLQTVKFLENSDLTLIGEYAFSNSNIENITFPPKLSQIGERAFFRCKNLKTVDFLNDCELVSIGKYAFSDSSIESLSIPSKVEVFDEGWCHCTTELKNISISYENKVFKYFEGKMIVGKSKVFGDVYDVLYFVRRDIKKIKIPSFIKYINSFSFSGCKNLKDISIPENSELISIGKYAFYFSAIEKITIPAKTTQIGELAFYSCPFIKAIEFLGENLSIKKFCFINCKALFIVSFPNAGTIYISDEAISTVVNGFSLFTCANATISLD